MHGGHVVHRGLVLSAAERAHDDGSGLAIACGTEQTPTRSDKTQTMSVSHLNCVPAKNSHPLGMDTIRGQVRKP